MTGPGRPSKYTPELIAEICDRLSEGEPLAEICRDAHMPHPSTVRCWARADESISLAIADARENGEDRLTANIRRTAKGDAEFSTGDVQRDKLVIDLDLKLLAKWNPKKYADRTIHAGDPESPLIPPALTIICQNGGSSD